MPKFQVLQRVDAFIDYVAEIEADDMRQAALLASDGAVGRQWLRRGEQEFDARLYVALGSDGAPIGDTQCGDF